MGGTVTRGRDCPANYPPSSSRWMTKRLVYDQARGGTLYTQPNVLTAFFDAEAPYEDPAIAVVELFGIASVRNLAAPAAQVDPLVVSTQAATGQPIPPQAGRLNPAAPTGFITSGRGYASPQWMVRFSSGDNTLHTLFVDGGCVLALPARHVQVWSLTQILLFPPTDGEVSNLGTTVAGTMLTEALVTAKVSWAKDGFSSAPAGMATFTQISNVDSANPTFPCVFERPPGARRVQCTPPIATAGTWGFVKDLGAAPQILTVPPPASNVAAQWWDVPHAAAGIQFGPTPPVAAGGAICSAIWEIGVR